MEKYSAETAEKAKKVKEAGGLYIIAPSATSREE